MSLKTKRMFRALEIAKVLFKKQNYHTGSIDDLIRLLKEQVVQQISDSIRSKAKG